MNNWIWTFGILCIAQKSAPMCLDVQACEQEHKNSQNKQNSTSCQRWTSPRDFSFEGKYLILKKTFAIYVINDLRSRQAIQINFKMKIRHGISVFYNISRPITINDFSVEEFEYSPIPFIDKIFVWTFCFNAIHF